MSYYTNICICLIFVWYQSNIWYDSCKDDNNQLKGVGDDDGLTVIRESCLILFNLVWCLFWLTLGQWYGHLVSKKEDFTDIGMDFHSLSGHTNVLRPPSWYEYIFPVKSSCQEQSLLSRMDLRLTSFTREEQSFTGNTGSGGRVNP